MCPVINRQHATAARKTSPSLQRGKACLSCRRRKMKCDGVRPVCTPCHRGERAEDCEYTDGLRRPRTLTLEEDIARLKARVQELENPDEAIPSVQLHAPYADPSINVGVINASVHMSQAHVQAPSYHHGQTRSPIVGAEAEFETDVRFHAIRALSVMRPYAAEIGFFLDIDRLRVQGTQVLPALQSALALWSVYIASISKLDHGQDREQTQTFSSNLLSRTQTQLASALGSVDAEPDPAIYLHIVQTGILLAYYMQRIGQVVGARYYASGTWAMAMMLRLHERTQFSIGAEEGDRVSREMARETMSGNMNAFTFSAGAMWAQPLDGIEAEERVRAFWAVYALDRWFGAVYEGSRQSIATDGSAGNVITVPWPGLGGINQVMSDTVQQLLYDPSHDFTQDGVAAVHAKASVLLGEATAIAASYMADNAISQSPAFSARFGTLDALLRQCLGAAMTMPTESNEVLVTVHLVALAHVMLHRPFITTYGPSRRRCIEGALGVVRVLDRMGEGARLGVGGISPVYATVWTVLCLALHAELLRLRAHPNATDPSRRREEGDMMDAIRRLVGVLSAVSQRCPSRFFAANIEAVLPVLESITI